jgi:hypothetical protein
VVNITSCVVVRSVANDAYDCDQDDVLSVVVVGSNEQKYLCCLLYIYEHFSFDFESSLYVVAA